jgi:hypothetical protein
MRLLLRPSSPRFLRTPFAWLIEAPTLALALLLIACGGAAQHAAEHPSTAHDAVVAPAPQESPGLGSGSAGDAVSMPVAQARSMAAPADVEEDEAAPVAAQPTTTQAGPTTQVVAQGTTRAQDDADAAQIARAKRMLDIEARFRIEVDKVAEAATELRRGINQHGGHITSESVAEQSAGVPTAEFTLRVPSDRVYALIDAIGSIGVVRSRQVQARDIGKEYYDATLRLRNLEITRDRLAEVLKQAVKVEDILRIEQELTRVRGEIEQIKGHIRYLSDRAALATVYVSLFTAADAPAVEIITPHAKLFPGLHAGYLLDIQGDGSTDGFFGGGLSLGLARQASLNVEGFRRVEEPSGGLDAFTATLEGRVHSEFFGGGTRQWLDPFLGLRAGYARFEGRNEILLGALLGIDIFKTETVRIDLTVHGSTLFGTSAGAHAVVSPSLGFEVAF